MLEAIEKFFPYDVNYVKPEGGMFIWIELPSDIDTKELLDESIKRRVAYVPGQSFFPDENKKNTMRLNFSAMEKEKISEGIQILGNLISEVMDKV